MSPVQEYSDHVLMTSVLPSQRGFCFLWTTSLLPCFVFVASSCLKVVPKVCEQETVKVLEAQVGDPDFGWEVEAAKHCETAELERMQKHVYGSKKLNNVDDYLFCFPFRLFSTEKREWPSTLAPNATMFNAKKKWMKTSISHYFERWLSSENFLNVTSNALTLTCDFRPSWHYRRGSGTYIKSSMSREELFLLSILPVQVPLAK